MEPNRSITIDKVANGYLVRPAFNPAWGDRTELPEMLVFQSMDGDSNYQNLLQWIHEHFAKSDGV